MYLRTDKWFASGLLVFLFFAIGCAFWLGQRSMQDELNQKQSRIDRAFRHWESKVGGTSLWPGSLGGMITYNLRTFDSGKNWYAVEYDDDWGMRVVGVADEFYPWLLAQINGGGRLTQYVETNGSLGMVDGIREEEASLLRKAGFRVEHQ